MIKYTVYPRSLIAAFFLHTPQVMKNFMFMKKISLLSLVLLSGFGVVSAQTTTMDPDKAHKPLRTAMSTDVRFGVRAGVNLASLEIDDDNNTSMFDANRKTSLFGGVFVNIPIGGALRFQPELSYLGQGSKIKGNLVSNPNPNPVVSYELDYSYIAVPLVLQLQTAGGFFVEAGPQIGFLISAREEQNSGPEADLEDRLRKTDFALVGGLGYLTRIGLGFNARYMHGLSNVYNNDASQSTLTNAEISNRGIQLGLTYHFGAAK